MRISDVLTYVIWLFAPVPAALVLYQLFYLRMRRRFQTAMAPTQGKETTADEVVKQRSELYFKKTTLFMDLGVPAALLYIVAVAGFEFVTKWSSGIDTSSADQAAQNLGVFVWFGAYVASLQVLLPRVVRRDVTPGMSYRALIHFFLGIVIGAIVLVLLPSELVVSATDSKGAVKPDPTSTVSPALLRLAICFSAGFAPQIVVSSLTAISERFWASKTAAPSPRNDVPISFVNGITPDIESRLADEGITNIANLAFADPVSLIKNTVFSRNQIINWMDQALLMDVLPESFPALRRCGISGALDLSACKGNDTVLTKYAAECKIDKDILKSIADRLDDDQQVSIVRALYKDAEPGTQSGANSGFKGSSIDKPATVAGPAPALPKTGIATG